MDQDKETHIEQLDWLNIPPELKPGLSRQKLSRRKLRGWSLVLEARGIPWRSERTEQGWQLLVPAERFQEACAELSRYEQENRNWPPPPPADRPLHENTASTLWVLIALALFHNIAVQQSNPFGHAPLDWVARGSAHAAEIRAGEWWRLLTALTLHSGPLHLFGNIVVGGIFMVRLCWILGSGYAWFLVLISGALGNLLNALVQSPAHRSIGASTAVFAAVGLLATINMLHYRRSLWRRWPLPVAAALGLLALLGVGGENTDVGAHLFGFLAGLLLGLPVDRFRERTASLAVPLNRLFALLSVVLICAAWWLALR